MKTIPITARERTELGTRACRRLRQQGEVPANLFGSQEVDGKTQNICRSLAVSAYEVYKLLEKRATVLELDCQGRKDLVQLTDVQRDALGDNVLHVDLLLIDPTKPITSTVTLVIKGEPKGVKAGGHLEVYLHELEVEALPGDMPRDVLVRVDHLDVDDVLYVKDLALPQGVTAITDADQLVAQVVQHVEQPEAEAAPAEGAAPSEPEVIGKGKKEEDAE